MRRIEESILINRPSREVFAYLEARAHDPEWMALVQESHWLDDNARRSADPVAVGRRGRMVMNINGKRSEFIDEVTEYEPGRRIAHRTVRGPMLLSTACICEPTSAGCKATVVGEADRLVDGVLRPLIEPFVARSIRRSFKADLARLKEIMEGRSSRPDEV